MTTRTRALLVGLLALPPAPALAADQGATGAATSTAVAGVNPGVIDGATARKLAAAGVKVVDVRTPAEFAGGHVPGAINIPHDEMAARHTEVGPPSTPVILYCRTGRRTAIAAKVLRENGFSTIFDLQSYDRWVESEPKK